MNEDLPLPGGIRVLKFGGTSLAGADRLDRAAEIVAAESCGVVVVVSATGDTTDRLVEAAEAALRGDGKCVDDLKQELTLRHLEVLGDSKGPARVAAVELLDALGRSLAEPADRTSWHANILSFGERLAACVVAERLRSVGLNAQAVDSRDLLITGPQARLEEGAAVDHSASRERARAELGPMLAAGTIPVVTGFIARAAAKDAERGVTTTLGRGGSDYTATLLGAYLAADEVQVLTDVDGILTADPRLVREARTLTHVSYAEALEMAYFGTRVLHPHTLRPLLESAIPVRVRSTLSPSAPGTLVVPEAPSAVRGAKTVTSLSDHALVTVAGQGMAGVLGTARRIFEASESVGVSVVMISQACSEQAVSLVVPAHHADRLASALRKQLAVELAAGSIQSVTVRPGVAIVSAVGQGMSGMPGTAGRFLVSLGRARVNVLAIAQGASELSISVAVDQQDVVRAVRASHTAFGLTRIINLVLVGSGRVGSTLLRLLAETRTSMDLDLDLELRLVGIVSSRRAVFDDSGIPPEQALDRLASGGPRPDDDELLRRVLEARHSDVALVDVTAADTLALHLASLRAGVHVVTANKLPLAGSAQSFDDLQAAARAHGVRYGYETTFGAGLPVLHTLRELVDTGDRVARVLGCLSGTLGFLCTRLEEGVGLVEAVAEAEAAGYTEPDPREDLSGRDVGRKALIVARSIGLAVAPEDVELLPMVPGLDQGLDEALAAHGPVIAAQIAAAKEAGEVLRYVADISPERVTVGLQAVPVDGPLGSLRGPDNVVVFETARYRGNPLSIRGPGAGAEVTAAGVLGDLLKIAGDSTPI